MHLEILTETQKKVLNIIGKNGKLCKTFYLTGGTALAAYYLGHRYSEDLDFFSLEEVDPLGIDVFLKDKKRELGYDSFEYQQSLNRNLYFLKYGKEELKIEFTYFPFTQIESPKSYDGLRVESLLDIAVNKLFTIYQRTAARDYIDLYMICRNQNYLIEDLIKKARIKFDWHIDPLQLGTQFYKANETLDLPRMIVDIPEQIWRDFFIQESRKLKYNILE
ncbi:MAG: nucleotidyl transferase AbiEii/AbiGii toxin family protein [Patescibacteria group bacterium]